jgi:UDP-glucose 4-epimerase
MRSSPRFQFIEGDLTDLALLERAMQGVEFVHHLAANPDVKFTDGDPTNKDLEQNVVCTYNVLEAMRRNKVRKLGFSSTSAVYGIAPEMPIHEDRFFPRPISLYGATKLACEALISSFQNLFEMQCWVFRFANIVGPKVRSRGRTVIADFIYRLQQDPERLTILGNGKQAKSYLLSEECVAGILYAVDHASAPLNIFNLGCPDWLEVDQIARMVVEAMGLQGVKFEYTGGEGGWAGDVPRFRLDVSRINKLGWSAHRDSAAAVAVAIQATLTTMGVDKRS